MNKLYLPSILTVIVLFLFYGCGLVSDADTLCGVDKRWDSNLGTEPSYESLDALTGNRIFKFEDLSTPENICTEEHVKAVFNLGLKDNKMPPGTKAYGLAYWNFFEKMMELGPYDTHMENIGLKQAFKGEPGWIGLQIIFEFPTQGSLAKDKEWFHEHVKHCSIEFQYKESL
ncbi:MAG TPA: hypothetical protein PLQ57_07990 [Saprospiraceae bacterium]|nr:hypothetical protein [Saprospiraceae bacterium]HRG65215.1 hypothetical protein [Saprospiraceae bacterium]